MLSQGCDPKVDTFVIPEEMEDYPCHLGCISKVRIVQDLYGIPLSTTSELNLVRRQEYSEEHKP